MSNTVTLNTSTFIYMNMTNEGLIMHLHNMNNVESKCTHETRFLIAQL